MSRRTERIASIIAKELAMLLLTEAKDPRVVPISITEVRLNDDLSVARVRYVPLGGKGSPGLQEGLDHVAKKLRGPIGRTLQIRHAPELRFERDLNFEHSERIQDLLAHLPPPAEDSEEPGAKDA